MKQIEKETFARNKNEFARNNVIKINFTFFNFFNIFHPSSLIHMKYIHYVRPHKSYVWERTSGNGKNREAKKSRP